MLDYWHVLLSRAFLQPLFRLLKMTKKILAVLAFAPVAVLADDSFAGITIPTQVSQAVQATKSLGEALAEQVGPAVLTIGAAFLTVAVAMFCYRLVVKFLNGSKRG